MDFKDLIIGEKIRAMHDPEQLESLHFDDEYFSMLMFQEKN